MAEFLRRCRNYQCNERLLPQDGRLLYAMKVCPCCGQAIRIAARHTVSWIAVGTILFKLGVWLVERYV